MLRFNAFPADFVQVLRGDVLFFAGGILTHGNKPIVSGSRSSLAIYTPARTLNWSRLARMNETDATTHKPSQSGKAFQEQKEAEKKKKKEAIRKAQSQPAGGMHKENMPLRRAARDSTRDMQPLKRAKRPRTASRSDAEEAGLAGERAPNAESVGMMTRSVGRANSRG